MSIGMNGDKHTHTHAHITLFDNGCNVNGNLHEQELVWESIYGENWELPTFHSFSVAFYGFGGPLVLATDGFV